MAHLIDKNPLVEWVEKSIERAKAERVLHPKTILAAKNYLLIEDYNKLLSFIDTLEVKEVDLEKEIDDYVNSNFSECEDGVLLSDANSTELTLLDVAPMARHFYALGLKAKQS